MKQDVDVFTGDLVGGVPARRGRPPTGKALSASERKRKSLEAAGRRALSITLPVAIVEALDAYRLGKDLTYSEVMEKLLIGQLLTKR